MNTTHRGRVSAGELDGQLDHFRSGIRYCTANVIKVVMAAASAAVADFQKAMIRVVIAAARAPTPTFAVGAQSVLVAEATLVVAVPPGAVVAGSVVAFADIVLISLQDSTSLRGPGLRCYSSQSCMTRHRIPSHGTCHRLSKCGCRSALLKPADCN